MKLTRFLIFLILLVPAMKQAAFAQKNHFIYIQTENRQPFYVKLDKKVFSSSISGYVIIPKLVNGEYTFTLGFPKNEWPEQNVTFTVNNNDAGYLFKNFGDKGWGFYNLQNSSITMAGTNTKDVAAAKETKPETIKEETKPAPKQEEVAKTEIKKEEPAVKEEIKPQPENIIKKEEPPVKEAAKPAPEKEAPKVDVKPEVKPIDEKPVTKIERTVFTNNDDGTELVYKITTENKTETVAIFIPADKKAEKPAEHPKEEQKKEDVKFIDLLMPAPDSPAVEKEKHVAEPVVIEKVKIEDILKPATQEKPKTDTIAENKTENKPVENNKPAPPKEEKPAAEPKIDPKPDESNKPMPAKEEKPKTEPTVENKTENSKPALSIPNSNCRDNATEDDFIKLRRKMVAEDNDDDMITVARKVFKTKCFTTLQVKNLSGLFTTDESKYKLFDAAYPYTSDSENYVTLLPELKDSYYINRFKSMIRL